jgi:hypothetical protein
MSAAPDLQRLLTAVLSMAMQIKQVFVLSLFPHECGLNGAAARINFSKKYSFRDCRSRA